MSNSISDLASGMVSRKKAGDIDPYTLFLGAGASKSSGCSSMMDIVNNFLKDRDELVFKKWESEIEKASLINKEYGRLLEEKTNIEKRTIFFDKWGKLDCNTRHSILKKHLLIDKDPSKGYEALIELIIKGYIKTVFSTNLDNLLEDALGNSGIQLKESDRIIIGKDRDEDIFSKLSQPCNNIKLIKLHGTLESPTSYKFTKKEIFGFKGEIKSLLSRLINQSLIIVGYSGQDRDIDSLFEDERYEIYFVNPIHPCSESRVYHTLAIRETFTIIDGIDGEFDTFFEKLTELVKRKEGEDNYSNSELSKNGGDDSGSKSSKSVGKSQLCMKVFYSTDEFFSRYLKSTNLFNHTYPFVGRDDILSHLNDFIESDKKIALLPGRGGIGKSKILLEFGKILKSKNHEWELRYLSENILLTQDSISELPDKKCIIIVDDAHRREDIITLLEIVQQENQANNQIKIILAFRPHGQNYIKSICNRCGFDTREIEEISEVQDLKQKEREELGRLILGQKYNQYLNPLIKVAKDSTIVLVIGARLIAENKVHPALLQQDKEFQDTVFRRFQEDILAGTISDDLDATFCQCMLSIISILSPIQIDDKFIKKVAEFLDVKESKLKKSFDILERSRILHRIGSKLRITPDILSDHILHDACITSYGGSTGYSQEIFEAFRDICLENILRNLSELDWRVNREQKETDLLEGIWDKVENEFKNSSNLVRANLLNKLNNIAYFQPNRTLELIQYAINNPMKATEQDQALFYQYTHEDVIKTIPSLLERIAYSFEHLPRCCELLWYLEKNNRKQENFDLNSTMTKLANLSKYEMNKPLEYNDLVLDFVEKQLNCSNDSVDTISLLDIIDPMLKKDGESTQMVGYQLEIKTFPILYDRTKTIRKRAIYLIADLLNSESPNIRLRALKSLSGALYPPFGLFGRNVPDDEVNSWLPEQMEILELIEDSIKSTTYPIIKIKIQSSLDWHAKHSRQVRVKEKANSIIDSISNTFDIKFARAIGSYYDIDYGNYENHREQIKKEMESVAKEFLIRCGNEGRKAYETLRDTISQFEECKVGVQPGEFLHTLSIVDYEVAIEICKFIVKDTSTSLKNDINALLSGIRENNTVEAIKLTNDVIDSEDAVLYKSIACGYAYQGWAHNIKTEEIKLIKILLNFEDKDTKKYAIESLRGMSKALMNDALSLALTVEIGNNESLADAYCGVFNSNYGIPPESLDNEQLILILKKISKINILESNLYNLNTFLTYCSTKIPEELVDFLLERIDLSKSVEQGSNGRFQPLPFIDFFDNGLNGIALCPHYKRILRKVRDRSLSTDWQDSFWLPKLYSYVSENYSLSSLEVLNEWVNTGDEEKVTAVGLLIKEAPSDFVFSNPDFVSNLLTNAIASSNDCYDEVRSNLLNSVDHGGKTGIAGQPSPHDEKTRDKAQEFMGKYQVGSPTWNFYKWLHENAKKSIKDWLERDEEMLED